MSSAGQQHRGEQRSTDRKVEWLRTAQAYPEPTHDVEAIETHMAWVFLTEQHAYKMKKPVRTTYLDFSSLEKRRRDAEREVQLNRRLAPHVYLGVVALTMDAAGSFALQGEGEVAEWLVKMQRLPRERMLDAAIASGRVDPADVSRVARLLAGFYHRAPPAPLSASDYLQRMEREIEEADGALSTPHYGLDGELRARVLRRLRKELHEQRATLRARTDAGRVVEGHGDLRPEHICLLPQPVIIDCLEFNRELRCLDALSELTYLALECDRMGASRVGRTVLDTYCRQALDPCPQALQRFFYGYHACVRAKLAVWHLDDDGVRSRQHWVDKARHYLRLADAA